MEATSIGFAYAGDSMKVKAKEAKTMEGKAVSVTIRVPDDVYRVVGKISWDDRRAPAEVARLLMLRGFESWKRDHLLYEDVPTVVSEETTIIEKEESGALASTHELKWFSLNRLKRFEYILLRKTVDIFRSKLRPVAFAGLKANIDTFHRDLPDSEKTIHPDHERTLSDSPS